MELMILGLGHFANVFYPILVILKYLSVTFAYIVSSEWELLNIQMLLFNFWNL